MSGEEYRRRWPELKARAKQLWSRLSDDDLDRIDGQRENLIVALEERYGRTRQELEPEVRDFEQNFFESAGAPTGSGPAATGPSASDTSASDPAATDPSAPGAPGAWADRPVAFRPVRTDGRDADATGVPRGDDVAAGAPPTAPPLGVRRPVAGPDRGEGAAGRA